MTQTSKTNITRRIATLTRQIHQLPEGSPLRADMQARAHHLIAQLAR